MKIGWQVRLLCPWHMGKALNVIVYTFEWLDCIVKGGSLTRRPPKVTSLSLGRGNLANNRAKVQMFNSQ